MLTIHFVLDIFCRFCCLRLAALARCRWTKRNEMSYEQRIFDVDADRIYFSNTLWLPWTCGRMHLLASSNKNQSWIPCRYCTARTHRLTCALTHHLMIHTLVFNSMEMPWTIRHQFARLNSKREQFEWNVVSAGMWTKNEINIKLWVRTPLNGRKNSKIWFWTCAPRDTLFCYFRLRRWKDQLRWNV